MKDYSYALQIIIAKATRMYSMYVKNRYDNGRNKTV